MLFTIAASLQPHICIFQPDIPCSARTTPTSSAVHLCSILAPQQRLADMPGSEKEAEYLVKWIGKAHIHNEWVPEPLLMRIAKRKVINFKRRYGSQPCMLMEQAWTQPCTFICRRSCLSGPGWEVLVKWCHLGYEHATWEVSILTCIVACATFVLPCLAPWVCTHSLDCSLLPVNSTVDRLPGGS